ncbi:acetoin utilization AcuB family protein [Brevibacillus dissolubilis]|uniref:acetoin utilization AcuB family protein n=1 Tax=Brevibacillus dissolubilis TaxID=1844116 RepID=UPI0011166FA3|nr:acetoin utilization AcuB family protein [Brevibacillus dissolubilis]
MRIEEIMRKRLVTVTAETTLGEALSLLRGNRIRHLPVLSGEKLVGIVSDRDLRDALPSVLCRHDDDYQILGTPVKEIMKTDVITAHPLDFIEDAAATVYEHRVGSLPIVENNKLVGIVTESDILNCLVELFGVNRASSHIEVRVDDRTGMLAEVSQVFREAKVNVISVMVYPSREDGKKNLVFRVQTIDPRHIIQLLSERGFDVIAPIEGGLLP